MSKTTKIITINMILIFVIIGIVTITTKKPINSTTQTDKVVESYKLGYNQTKTTDIQDQKERLNQFANSEQGQYLIKKRYIETIAYAPEFCKQKGYVFSPDYIKNYHTMYKSYIEEIDKEYQELPSDLKTIIQKTDNIDQEKSFANFYMNDFNSSKEAMNISSIKEYCQIIGNNSEVFLTGSLDVLNELLKQQNKEQ